MPVAPRPRYRVTVCIASFNTRRATEVAVRRVLAQRGLDLQLWVGDGGSGDGSAQMLRAFAAKGLLHLDEAPGGRTHGEWLDLWSRTVDTPYCAFVDSDLFLLRASTLHRIVAAAAGDDAVLASSDWIPEIRDYVSDINGDRQRLAPRVAPWLVAFRTEDVRALDVSWCYRWEARPDLPEGAQSWDVGADVTAALTAAGRPPVVMPASFGREFVHVGGLSWRGRRRRAITMKDRAKRAFVDAALVTTRIADRAVRRPS